MDAKGKILVIDDDPDFVKSISAILEGHGFEVMAAPDGKTGFKAAKEGKPDLILVDIMMETWSEGLSLVNRFREEDETKDIPLLLVSSMDIRGRETPYPGEFWLSERFILTKPISEEELLKAIERAMGA